MANTIAISLISDDLNRMENVMAHGRQHAGVSDFEHINTFILYAAICYCDFYERAVRGELDNDPSAQLLIRTVSGFEHLATPRETIDHLSSAAQETAP